MSLLNGVRFATKTRLSPFTPHHVMSKRYYGNMLEDFIKVSVVGALVVGTAIGAGGLYVTNYVSSNYEFTIKKKNKNESNESNVK